MQCSNFYATDLSFHAGRQCLRCAWALSDKTIFFSAPPSIFAFKMVT